MTKAIENPFVLGFGKKPQEYIDRTEQENTIIHTFAMQNPSAQTFMVAGIRGSGKTVLLSELSQHYAADRNWIVLNLASDMDILSASVAELQSQPELRRIHLNFGVTVAGVSISNRSNEALTDNGVLLKQMILELKKKGKKIIFLIDEIISNPFVQNFCSIFQILVRENMPVYLVMAGLYDNIMNLQNKKTLTFLYRAPKILLEPLSLGAIANRYSSVLQIPIEEAVAMAKETKGYPFAFQILGYLCYQQKENYQKLLDEYDQYLAEYAYEKIWSELSEMDRTVIRVIASGKTTIKDIRESLGISPQMLNVYRMRLIRQGIADGSHRGELTITLPRFEKFIELYGV